ncbi:MAG TPA: FAD:protein FMN transferase [Planctomycetota bacterium]|nr:FAD:protein FMN transferase [Planctomycetota bacterium]
MLKFFPCLLPLVMILAGCAHEPQEVSDKPGRYESTREMMGTYVTIVLWADGDAHARRAGDAAFEQIARIERSMSDYDADSELSKINREAFERDVQVSDAMLDVLKMSLEYAELSNGAFDVTIRPLKVLWKQAGEKNALPDAAAIAAARESVGSGKIGLDARAKTVRFLKPSMQLDLGGIAKGYAVDQAIAELRRQGIAAALVNAGGDIATMGAPPEAEYWKVGIQHPGKRDEMLPEVLKLSDAAVATSGDYERFVQVAGKRYSHIVDPVTGWPVGHVSSVTVIAPSATQADALATALSVLGPRKGIELAGRLPNIEAMFIIAADGAKTIVRSKGFDSYLLQTEDRNAKGNSPGKQARRKE